MTGLGGSTQTKHLLSASFVKDFEWLVGSSRFLTDFRYLFGDEYPPNIVSFESRGFSSIAMGRPRER